MLGGLLIFMDMFSIIANVPCLEKKKVFGKKKLETIASLVFKSALPRMGTRIFIWSTLMSIANQI